LTLHAPYFEYGIQAMVIHASSCYCVCHDGLDSRAAETVPGQSAPIPDTNGKPHSNIYGGLREEVC
jgi:hypothetical protein